MFFSKCKLSIQSFNVLLHIFTRAFIFHARQVQQLTNFLAVSKVPEYDRKYYKKNIIDKLCCIRRIVKTISKQIEYLVCAKDAITIFHSIDWILMYVIVTIYKTALRHRSCIVTTKLRSRI